MVVGVLFVGCFFIDDDDLHRSLRMILGGSLLGWDSDHWIAETKQNKQINTNKKQINN